MSRPVLEFRHLWSENWSKPVFVLVRKTYARSDAFINFDGTAGGTSLIPAGGKSAKGKANKATWLVLFRQIILFIPLCVLLPMIGGLGIRGVWLAIALTDAVLVVITIAMMASEFRKMPPTSQTLR